MKILVVGGTTGGHVTPIRPVLSEFKKLHPRSSVDAIGLANDPVSKTMERMPDIDTVHYIQAGKWRRYATRGFFENLFDVRTSFFNARDAVRLVRGYFQAKKLLQQIQPRAVFIKGGFVGVPVGYAASRLGIPFITHDADAIAGFANRLIAKKATLNAVAAPAEYFPYDPEKVREVGVPIMPGFTSVTARQRTQAKQDLGIDASRPVVLVTGGGLGAVKINQAMVSIARQLTQRALVIHVAGEKHRLTIQRAISSHGLKNKDYQVHGFTDKMLQFMTAADVVITRAGATATAEIAAMGKPAIFIPAPQLADQQKNTELLKKSGLLVMDEMAINANPETMLTQILKIVDDTTLRLKLHKAALGYARPDAAKAVAQLIDEIASR